MFLKKSWFYIIIYGFIFITFMCLDNSIVKQPKLMWSLFLISMILMIISSIIAIILSVKENKKNKGAFSKTCFIISICLIIFVIIWLGLVLLVQYGGPIPTSVSLNAK